MSQLKSNNNKLQLFAIIFLILIGGFLRLYNLKWDSGMSFHPDERNIATAVSRINLFDNLDPEFFAYGGLSVYLHRGTAQILSINTGDASWLTDWGKISLIGRAYSAIFSTITLALIYKLAKTIFNKKVALTSLAIAAFVPGLVQTAHYATTESLLSLLAVLICILSLKLFKRPNLTNFTLLGLTIGVAMGAKTSSLAFFMFEATTFLTILLWKHKKVSKHVALGFLLIISILTSLAVFSLLSPHTFLSWDKFVESMEYEGGVVSGALQVPYTHQFINTIPYLYQLKNTFWTLGPISVIGILGMIYLSIIAIKKKDAKYIIFLSFPIAYFIYIGSWHAKFVRYMIPVLPTLIISSASVIEKFKDKFKISGNIFKFGFITITILWGISFFSIYTRPQTRILASKWIYENVPTGSTIYGEHWDDGLPLNLPSDRLFESRYDRDQLTIYEPDNLNKLNYYADMLPKADYVAINSRRLYGTLINLDQKYPLTSKYYKLLFAEKLGFEKVYEITSYPSLFGVEIKTDGSEESFQVYDHPKVIVFKNTNNLSAEAIYKILSANTSKNQNAFY